MVQAGRILLARCTTMFDQFNEWLCKTNFSFLHGASHPRDLVECADRLGYQSLCINDFDGAYGLARCYRELEYLKQQDRHRGLKLNYGAEIHLQRDHDLPLILQDTLVLVAQDQQGYTNLNRLLSHAHRDGKDYANLPLATLLEATVDGLFAIRPMRGALRCRASAGSRTSHRPRSRAGLRAADWHNPCHPGARDSTGG